MDVDPWQAKYYSARDRLDSEERRWQSVEETLRRLASRLCVAARGHDARLDATIDNVSAALRRNDDVDPMRALIDELTRTIASLDEKPANAIQTPPPQSTSSHAADASALNSTLSPLFEALGRLLDRLAREPAFKARADELDDLLHAARTPADLSVVADAIGDIVDRQRAQLLSDKSELEKLVQQVSGQLDEIADFMATEDAAQSSAEQSSRELDTRVQLEVHALGASVQQADDLGALQQHVRERLATIGDHLRDFRARESARMASYRERAEGMRTRVEQLESEAQVLQASLRREQRLAMTDALTGIPNRFAYEDRVDQEFKRWKRFARPLAIATLDIDHFKTINDSYGHRAGDKVLRIVGQHLAKHVRETDFVARYGGEEFVMVLIGAGPAEALSVSEGIRGMVESLGFHVGTTPVRVTMSCGVAGFVDGDTPELVFERADRALYQAKSAGRNCCVAG